MEKACGHSRTALPVSTISVAILAFLVACACKGATISSGSKDDTGHASDLRLSFRVLGVDPEGDSGAAKSISRLILPTASTLTVSLEPLADGLSTPAPVTMPITETSGASTLTASFADIQPGRYKAQAVASGVTGEAKFSGASEIDVAEGQVEAEVFLLPTASDHIGVVGNSLTAAVNAGGASVIEIPASAIPVVEHSAIPAGSYGIELRVQSGPGVFEYFSLDVDGAIMGKGTFNTDGMYYQGEMVSQVIVAPSSSLKPTYLVLYNSSSPDPDDYFKLHLY